MFVTGIWFVGSMVGIILVARFALYIPARKLAHAGGLSQSSTGQLLGYLTSAPELVATVFVASTGLFTVVTTNILGSNIINTLLATVAAVLFGQLRRITGSRFRFEQAVVAGSIVRARTAARHRPRQRAMERHCTGRRVHCISARHAVTTRSIGAIAVRECTETVERTTLAHRGASLHRDRWARRSVLPRGSPR